MLGRRRAAGAGDRAGRGRRGFQVARVTFEILRPVPIGPVRVEAEVVRPGAQRADDRGDALRRGGELMRARAWRIRTAGDRDAARRSPPGRRRALRQGQARVLPTGQDVGYHTAMEWRSVARRVPRARGRRRSGCGCGYPLVAGEEPTPLQRTWSPPTSATGSAPCSTGPASSSSTSTSPSTSSGCRGRVGLRRRRHPAAAQRDRHRRVGALRRARPDRPRRPDAPDRRAPADVSASWPASSARPRAADRRPSSWPRPPRSAAKRNAPS